MTELSHIWQWKLTHLNSGRCTNGVKYCLIFCSYSLTNFPLESRAYNQIWKKKGIQKVIRTSRKTADVSRIKLISEQLQKKNELKF